MTSCERESLQIPHGQLPREQVPLSPFGEVGAEGYIRGGRYRNYVVVDRSFKPKAVTRTETSTNSKELVKIQIAQKRIQIGSRTERNEKDIKQPLLSNASLELCNHRRPLPVLALR